MQIGRTENANAKNANAKKICKCKKCKKNAKAIFFRKTKTKKTKTNAASKGKKGVRDSKKPVQNGSKKFSGAFGGRFDPLFSIIFKVYI